MDLVLSLEEHLSPKRDLIGVDFVKFVKSLWGCWSLFPRVEICLKRVFVFFSPLGIKRQQSRKLRLQSEEKAS